MRRETLTEGEFLQYPETSHKQQTREKENLKNALTIWVVVMALTEMEIWIIET